MEDLKLAGLWVIYPSLKAYRLAENLIVAPLGSTGIAWNYVIVKD